VNGDWRADGLFWVQLTYLLQNSLSGNSKTLVSRLGRKNRGCMLMPFKDGVESLTTSCSSERVVDLVAIRYEGMLLLSLFRSSLLLIDE
jgi:hypothetical protein